MICFEIANHLRSHGLNGAHDAFAPPHHSSTAFAQPKLQPLPTFVQAPFGWEVGQLPKPPSGHCPGDDLYAAHIDAE
ncbi:hypothetical protein ALO90_200093 [Pseudomonas amygdali pv. aesculi]|nr:hypothetical protein ALO90_200093 [Pseudomonas amygdali pv. aesculi]